MLRGARADGARLTLIPHRAAAGYLLPPPNGLLTRSLRCVAHELQYLKICTLNGRTKTPNLGFSEILLLGILHMKRELLLITFGINISNWHSAGFTKESYFPESEEYLAFKK